jgi:carbon storage regulator
MLVLTRKVGESLFIGDDIRVTVVSADNEKVRIGIEAPGDRRIFREELLMNTRDENRMAVQSSLPDIPAGNPLRGLKKK